MNGCQSTQDSAEMEKNYSPKREQTVAADQNMKIWGDLEYKAVAENLNYANSQIVLGNTLEGLSVLRKINAELMPLDLRDQHLRLMAKGNQRLGALALSLKAMQALKLPDIADLKFILALCKNLKIYACAAHNLIEIQRRLGAPTQAQQNEIWSYLLKADKPRQAFSGPIEKSWWSLREQIFYSGSATKGKQAFDQWALTNSSHSAAIAPPSALEELSRYNAPNIALLLPLSGRLSSAGKAIRDGVFAGYFTDTPLASVKKTDGRRIATPVMRGLAQTTPKIQHPRPFRSLKLYDSASTSITALIARAKREGADLIIGPLSKDKARLAASAAAQRKIPALLLNYIDEETQLPRNNSDEENIFQLGTAVEDEAATLAKALLNTQHQRLLVVHSGKSWSKRALKEFRALWPFPVYTAQFDEVKEVTSAVGDSMGVAASLKRKNELARLFDDQGLQFLPRARIDLDAVVALTSSVESRALVPALRFHFADNLPVYAISQSIRDSKNIRELAGFTVTELPILVHAQSQMENLVKTYNLSDSPLVELYALGYDAYQLATWIHAQKLNPGAKNTPSLRLSLATGIIELSADQRFNRKLVLANVDGRGKIRPSEDR
jgi:outer membrane PBP1 activator LpoA protein